MISDLGINLVIRNKSYGSYLVRNNREARRSGRQSHSKCWVREKFFNSQKKRLSQATAANLEIFEGKRAELEKNAEAKLEEAKKRGEQIADLVLNLTAKAGEEGKLFGSITVRDIVDACFSKGIGVEKSEIKLPEGPLRNTGDYEVGVQVHPDLIVKMKITVSAEV